jgi:hypothetical protein
MLVLTSLYPADDCQCSLFGFGMLQIWMVMDFGIQMK